MLRITNDAARRRWVLGLALVAGGVGFAANAEAQMPRRSSEGATDRALAAGFQEEAERLHSTPERWGDAAVFHYYAALYRGLDDPASARDLLIAANLFLHDGERERACATLERAAAIYLREGRESEANDLFLIAARVGELSCAARWDEIFDGMVPPAVRR